MDEFTKKTFWDQYDKVDEIFKKTKANDKYSQNAIANFNLFFQDISKLTCKLMTDIESGKIYKTPRKYSAWKKNQVSQDLKAPQDKLPEKV